MTEAFNRKPNCNCIVCDKAIYRRPSNLSQGGPYCSTICSNSRFKKDPLICTVCSAEIPRKKNAKTCSRKCSNIQRAGTTYHVGRPKDKANRVQRLKNKLLEIRSHKCNRCEYNKIHILHVHHVIERTNGGTDSLDNLELLCPNCHSEHHYK